jgi:hypothetical protein
MCRRLKLGAFRFVYKHGSIYSFLKENTPRMNLGDLVKLYGSNPAPPAASNQPSGNKNGAKSNNNSSKPHGGHAKGRGAAPQPQQPQYAYPYGYGMQPYPGYAPYGMYPMPGAPMVRFNQIFTAMQQT